MKALTGLMVVVVVVLLACASGVRALDIEMVTVGDPGNGGTLSGTEAGGYGPNRVCGAVDYVYSIGMYEVTAGQYTEFLNAVAATDRYLLYHSSMWNSDDGCKIERTGSSGNYSYSVESDWANRPVNYVSWGDAARFSNWLHNGQPSGAQDLSTTEDGSYFLDGAMASHDLLTVTRREDATFVIPSEDEWYKAAYYDGAADIYFKYPTGSDVAPSNDLVDPDPGNNATFYEAGGDYTIDSPYYRTEVGGHEGSVSPCGTFDQGGNVWEWIEDTLHGGSGRGVRGGSFHHEVNNLHAASRGSSYPGDQFGDIGFRVAEVPEPGSLSLLVLGGLALLRRRRA